jgi:VanZ family protein
MKLNTVFLALWTLLILALLLLPLRENALISRLNFPYFDKVVHCGLFAVFGFISIYGTAFSREFRYRLLFGLVLGLVLAVGTELGQSLVPSRDTSLMDLAADLLGLFFGLVAFTLLYSWRKRL